VEAPKEMQKKVMISDEDKSNIDSLLAQNPELANLRESLYDLFPAHDRLLIEVLPIGNSDMQMYQHQLLLQGLIVRSKGLLSATLGEVLKNDKPAVTVLLRAQCETLAAACYVERFPDKLGLVLHGTREKGAKIQAINVLTQVEQATKKHPGLLQDYDQLSELSHPNALSHTAFVQILDKETRKVAFSSNPGLRRGEAAKAVLMIHAWTKWFLNAAQSVHDQSNESSNRKRR